MNKKRIIITTAMIILPLFSLLVVSCTKALATDYYVDLKGSDQGKGTKFSPWRTLKKALTSLPPNQKHTIRVGRGTFDLGGNVSIPSGVNVVGAGISGTTITGELRLIGVQNLTISNLKLSGDKYKYDTALYIRDASQINIRNIVFNQYRSQAINIERTANSEISYIDIFDCTYNHHIAGGGGKQSRAITLANLTNVKFHDIMINTLTRGGQGIGSRSDAWTKDKPWSRPPSILTNVQFYNLDIKVDKWNAWGNGWTPQMAMELWHTHCVPCTISNSNFNSTLSLVAFRNSQPPNARVRVHDNLWYGNNPFYALEAGTENIEFDHNYIRGGSYPIASWGHNPRNLNVHHNIFENTKSPTLIGHFSNKVDNFKFVNNTVHITDYKSPIFRFAIGEEYPQEIRNNIFYNSSLKINNLLGASLGVDQNIFFNIKPVGSRAINLNPMFKLAGDIPSQYYRPQLLHLKHNFGAIRTWDKKWNPGKKSNGS